MASCDVWWLDVDLKLVAETQKGDFRFWLWLTVWLFVIQILGRGIIGSIGITSDVLMNNNGIPWMMKLSTREYASIAFWCSISRLTCNHSSFFYCCNCRISSSLALRSFNNPSSYEFQLSVNSFFIRCFWHCRRNCFDNNVINIFLRQTKSCLSWFSNSFTLAGMITI